MKAGTVLAGRFRLARLLGEGGIGIVWLAHDDQLDDEPVACKILRHELRGQRKVVADLKREVLLARKLNHPNVLRLYSFWETPEAVLVTMEHVDGPSLSRALEERGAPFTLDDVMPWLSDVGAALDYAHRCGILHRDVKPANMLLGPDGVVKIVDFGIARLGDDTSPIETPQTTEGTIYFMSPEQIADGPAGPRSDLYSLAASAYQLLSGAPPFHEGEVLAQIQVRPPSPIPLLSESVNRELLRALSKSPEKRHATCAEFVEALEAASDSSVIASRRPLECTRVAANAPTVVLGDFSIETRRSRLGRLLVEQGLITQEQLAESLLEQRLSGDKLGAALIDKGFLTEEELASILGTQLCIRVTRLADNEIDRGVATLLPRDLAERYAALPLRRTPYAVLVAMADPLDMEAHDELEAIFGASIEPLAATASDVRRAIARIHGS